MSQRAGWVLARCHGRGYDPGRELGNSRARQDLPNSTTMSQRKVPDVICVCGSGRKFADCCLSRRFGDEGSDQLGVLLEDQRRKFVKKHGREPGPADLVFFNVPEPPEPPSTWQRIGKGIGFFLAWFVWICVMVPGVPLACPLYLRLRGTHNEEAFWWAAFICGAWTLALAFCVFVVWGL